MRLRWTRPVLAHIAEISTYIRKGRIEGTRELVISRYPYIIVYRTVDEAIEILAVIHAVRDWPQSLPAA